MRFFWRALNFFLVCGLALLALPILAAPVPVKVVQTADGWQLQRDGRPFFVKGAGGTGRFDLLAAAGANSVRTWGGDDLLPLLDQAQKNGLTVTVGIWLHHEGDGDKFSYDDPAQCRQQLEAVRQAILRYKDHPAVLMWGIGNEMEGYGDGGKAAIWKNVNDCARLAKQLDPNHPVMTVIAELGGRRIQSINQYCPEVDIVGINSYAGAATVARRYAALNPVKPYIITEFGPPGFWEVPKTAWGAPLEPTSPQKADAYRQAYLGSVTGQPWCLGSYAFLWGSKQERTATWFGMFLSDGSKVNAVDTMTELWSGTQPKELCPEITNLAIDGNDDLAPGQTFRVKIETRDPANRPVKVRWVVQPEQTHTGTAGRTEATLPELESTIISSDNNHCEISAPDTEGGYRVFAYLNNGVGSSVGNLPFHVHLASDAMVTGKSATLPFYIYENQSSPANHYTPAGWMGKTSSLKMNPGWTDHPHSQPTCLQCQFDSGDNWGGIAWQDPAGDWGDHDGGWNLTGAKNVVFWARGESGGETVSFKFGLLGRDKAYFDTAAGELDGVMLTKDWKEYSIPIAHQNLSRIKTGFCWSVAGQGHPVTFYLDDIRFE